MDAIDTPKDQTPVLLQLVKASRFPGFPPSASKSAIFGVSFAVGRQSEEKFFVNA